MTLSPMILVVGFGGGAIIAVNAAIAYLRQRDRDVALQRRLADLRRSADLPVRTDHAGPSMTSMITAVGRTLAQSGLLPAATLAELQETLSTAAIGGVNGLSLFIGSKVLMLIGLPVLTFGLVTHLHIRSSMHLILPGLAAVVGLLLPDYIVGHQRKRYLKGVEAGLPDALDMMVICSEAGLGLEPSIERVAEEIEQAHPAIAREFRTTGREMRLTSDRRQVLINMGTRTNLDNLRRLATTLIQTIQFGTPLSQALRTLAVEMRQDNMTKYEGRAAKLPVLLTFPMILFILPCIFIVVGGPAALEAIRVLGNH